MKHLLTFAFTALLIISYEADAQKKRILFIGNSYTYVNNLPLLLADLAASTNDSIIYDSSTPGGFTLKDHSINATTLSKISAGNWDYVVLQEQSQLPSFPLSQVTSQVFPYARKLDSLIHAQNSCAETVFYMTWGRKNGDASNCSAWPPVCTYSGMDSLLYLRYKIMADDNKALFSPVGAVWRALRQNFPALDLYQSDESHPSLAGSYAAACSFYATIFRKNPLLIGTDAGLPSADAANIRMVVKQVVFDSLLKWNVGMRDPKAAFTFQLTGNQISLVNTSSFATSYHWHFGDGIVSAMQDPLHLYAQSGNYTVTLIASHCGRSDTTYKVISILASSLPVNGEALKSVFPNPASDVIYITDFRETAFFRLLDLNGRMVQEGDIKGESASIAVIHLDPGIYILEIGKQNLQRIRYKFVKAD